jgi:hypothetical protein
MRPDRNGPCKKALQADAAALAKTGMPWYVNKPLRPSGNHDAAVYITISLDQAGRDVVLTGESCRRAKKRFPYLRAFCPVELQGDSK